jgi:hypothetical protein
MTLWTFEIKFSYNTQFLFGSLMFITGEDGNLELLTRGRAPRHHKTVYREAPYYPIDSSTSSTSSGVHSGLNPYAGSYYFSAMTSEGCPIKAPIFQPSVEILSSSSSGASADRDSNEDHHEIRGIIYWNPAIEAHRINMVGSVRSPSHNM